MYTVAFTLYLESMLRFKKIFFGVKIGKKSQSYDRDLQRQRCKFLSTPWVA
jgi:hypothetical protein